MTELDKKYKEKKDIIKGLKDLFYKNKAMFIAEFSEFSISEKANLIAFLQVNDTKFYNEIKMLIDVKEQNMKVTMTTKENEKGVTIDTKDLPKIEQASKELVKAVKESQKTETELQIEKDAIALSRRAFINKIKVDKKFHAMTINYSGSNKKGGKETIYTGYEEMLDKKYDLIQSLIYPVMEILHFPEEWEDDIIITGISFNYDTENDNSLRGMVVTMQKTVEGLNCPLNINTPFIRFSEWVDNYCSFPSEDACWDYDVSEKVREIINNAFLYICGDTKTVQEKFC